MRWAVILITILFANNEVVNKVKKLIDYNFKLENLNKIKTPMDIQKSFKKNVIVIKKKEVVDTRSIRIVVYFVLNNRVYASISELLNGEITKSYKKMIKIGDKVGWCRLIDIKNEEIVFNCKGKRIVKKLVNKTISIKEKR